MKLFKCQMLDQDGEDEWSDVKAVAADSAAAEYAEYCDNHSAMECFSDEAEQTIVVKSEDGTVRKFKCQREAVPHYYSQEIDPAPNLPESDIPY